MTRQQWIILLGALLLPLLARAQLTDLETDFLEAEVTIVAFDLRVTRFRITSNNALVDVRNDVHVRFIEDFNQYPRTFAILAPMTAVDVVEGTLPPSAVRRYPLTHYLKLRDRYNAAAPTDSRKLVEGRYFGELDRWVESGGPTAELQTKVVASCGKIVMLFATPAERIEFGTTRREDFDFRVDVCTKVTVHRAHPQPEFKNPELVSTICGTDRVPLFRELCRRSGLR